MNDSITITVKQAADKLGVSKGLIYKLIHAGKFYPAIKIGEKFFVLKDEFEKWFEEQKARRVQG